MKTITDQEADRWIAGMKPEQIRVMIQEHHALKQGLCAQILSVPTGADDWVDRALTAGRRSKQCEWTLRKLLSVVEVACVDARENGRETTCMNCRGSGVVRDDVSCSMCRGTGARSLI